MHANDDQSVILKVYEGEVRVSSRPPEAEKSAIPGKPGTTTGVAENRGSSAKAWSLSVDAMRQIFVRPDGTATKPFRFSLKADRDHWVRWNRKQDEEMGEAPR